MIKFLCFPQFRILECLRYWACKNLTMVRYESQRKKTNMGKSFPATAAGCQSSALRHR
jgi:hypothetical protein